MPARAQTRISKCAKEKLLQGFTMGEPFSGNGKTIISSVLVEHLVQEQGPEEAVLYAFCDFRNPKSVDPVVILRTFLSELLLAYPCSIADDFADLVDAEKKKRQHFNRPLFEREEELHRFLDDEHPFYHYAVHCWVHYFPDVDTSTSDAIQALSRFLHASKTRAATHNLRQQVWFTDIKGFGHDPGIYYHPMRWIILHCKHPAVITHLPQLDLPAELIQCCLFASLWVKHIPATEVLLDAGGADVNAEHICAPCTQMMSCLLHAAPLPSRLKRVT
ncbi:hypothetical protein B0H16DRAFT_1895070 [Mycena metata]|uniref:Nephrocystin 3-like N-terminal domain-containing protein n=1 Tax=Mycena metata TaxID=1033252 RepID=A0AAD7MPR3_9AGAR|nr:hypothetical protein B0H16DRAFT_1895070 [Mycena metata]